MKINQNTVTELSLPNGAFRPLVKATYARPWKAKDTLCELETDTESSCGSTCPAQCSPRALRGTEHTWPQQFLLRDNRAGGQCTCVSCFELIHTGTRVMTLILGATLLCLDETLVITIPKPSSSSHVPYWLLLLDISFKDQNEFWHVQSTKENPFSDSQQVSTSSHKFKFTSIPESYGVISKIKGNIVIDSCLKRYFVKKKKKEVNHDCHVNKKINMCSRCFIPQGNVTSS